MYPVYLDFLPSFDLAKVLPLTRPNPCNLHHECHPVVNQNSAYVCLCPSNFKGNDCHSEADFDEFICRYDEYSNGDQCRFEKKEIRFDMKNNLQHRASVVQYFYIDDVNLDLRLFDPHIHHPLSQFLYIMNTFGRQHRK